MEQMKNWAKQHQIHESESVFSQGCCAAATAASHTGSCTKGSDNDAAILLLRLCPAVMLPGYLLFSVETHCGSTAPSVNKKSGAEVIAPNSLPKLVSTAVGRAICSFLQGSHPARSTMDYPSLYPSGWPLKSCCCASCCSLCYFCCSAPTHRLL